MMSMTSPHRPTRMVTLTADAHMSTYYGAAHVRVTWATAIQISQKGAQEHPVRLRSAEPGTWTQFLRIPEFTRREPVAKGTLFV